MAERSVAGGQQTPESLAQARYWEGVYTELVGLEDRMLATIQRLLPSLSPAARKEAERTNLTALLADSRSFHRRLAYWARRARELEQP